jgi:murein DD-endopeptidase MepM/ murein hydrolase activator NlpD
VASNRHAPEGTYDPYTYSGDDDTGAYEVYGSYDSYSHYDTRGQYDTGQFDSRALYDTGAGQFDTDGGQFNGYGRYDTHGSLWTETYEFAAAEEDGPAPEPVTGLDDIPAPAPAPVLDLRHESPAFSPEPEPFEEWNPTEESLRPVRGRHKVVKQRGGSMARSSAVLGVGMIAAVGAGGMATAQEKQPNSISVLDSTAAKNVPGVGALLSDDELAADPLTQGALTDGDTKAGRKDAGEALRSRILAQAQAQQAQADASAQDAAVNKAADAAAAKAAKGAADQRRAAEKARLAKLAKSFALPVSGAQLTSYFGQAGSLWSNNHTGQDFAAASGTPIKAAASGTIKEAGWAGSFGYRTILETKDGTELWFAHQSSMNVSAGEKVTAGQVIGRVGSTGNVTGAHLHFEVHPGGGGAIDPLAWLRGKGVKI